MRNGSNAVGDTGENTPHRKGGNRTKLKRNQNTPSVPYGYTDAVDAPLASTNAANDLSGRSPSKPSNRKTQSIKHKSNKLVQIPLQKVHLQSRAVPQISGQANIDSLGMMKVLQVAPEHEYQFSRGNAGQIFKEANTQNDAYAPQNIPHRSHSKTKHRKLSKIPSGSVNRESTLSPEGHSRTGNKQLEAVHSAAAALSSSNFQQMMIQNSFSAQPEFIVSGTTQSAQENYVKKAGIPGNTRATVNQNIHDIPQIFNQDKQAKTFNQQALPLSQQHTAGAIDSTRLSISGQLVQNFNNNVHSNGVNAQQTPLSQQLDFTRQQLLQQQARQQQNYKQHMQNVHLEIKGNTSGVQIDQYGPKQIVPIPNKQPVIGSNLTSSAPLQNFYFHQQSPSNTIQAIHSKQQNIFVQSSNPLSALKTSTSAEQEPENKETNGLQNSHSPFKSKTSKLIKHQKVGSGENWNQNGVKDVMDSRRETDAVSPSILMKNKKNSSKGQTRKQSANALYQSNQNKPTPTIGMIALQPRNSMQLQMNNSSHTSQVPQLQQSLMQGENHMMAAMGQVSMQGVKTMTIPPPAGHIQIVPINAFGQKSLQPQSSSTMFPTVKNEHQYFEPNYPASDSPKHKIPYTSQRATVPYPSENIRDLQHKIGSGLAADEDNQMQGSLNMTKQRVALGDGPPIEETAIKISDQQLQANSGMHKQVVKTHSSYTVGPSSSKKQNRPKADRSNSQMGTHPAAQVQNKQQSHTKKPHHNIMPGQDINLQKSGKQIVQGQQAYYGHVKMPESANSSGNNKTLPLSIFEMQFYQGDFIMQQKGNFVVFPDSRQISSNMGSKETFSNIKSGFVQAPASSQKPFPSAHMMPGQLQGQSLKIQSAGQPFFASKPIRGNHSQEVPQERQKVNFVALQNFHQQWLSTHGNSGLSQQQAQIQMPIRNGGGSQTNLNMAVSPQKWVTTGGNQAPSPVKNSQMNNKHTGLNSTIAANQASLQHQILSNPMQTLLQQQKLTATGSIPSTLIAQTKSQGTLYSAPVQVNGRHLQMPVYPMINFNLNNFSQVMQQQPLNQKDSQLKKNIEGGLPQYPMLAGQIDQIMLLNQGLVSQADAFTQQLYAMQLQQHQQEAQERQERRKGRRDTTNMFKRATSKIPFENAYVEDCYKFIIGYGNNSGLIRAALKQRSWWIEIQPVHSMFNFKWNPVSDGIKFARLGHVDPGKREQGTGTMGQKPVKDTKDVLPPVQDKLNMQMVNHMENHQLLTEKYNLLMVMQRFCDSHKESAFDIMPITFFVEIPDATKEQSVTQALAPFVLFYQTLETNREKLVSMKETLIRQLNLKIELEEKEKEDAATQGGGPQNKNNEKANQAFQDKIQRLESVTGAQPNLLMSTGKITKFKAFNFEKRTYQKFTMPLCHFDSYNLWLLKPTHLNRGRGIHVFRDIETLNKLIKQYCSGKEELSRKKEQPKDKENPEKHEMTDEMEGHDQMQMDSDQEGDVQLDKKTSSTSKKQSINKIKHNTFIIQKYIEKPLLICNRKFDIRVWVLLDQDHNVYFFKEGYLRTSSTEFGIDLQNIDNAFVHLTNNAVQKNASNYGDFEDGNQLGFPRFQHYIDDHYPESGVSVYNHLVPQMHEIVVKTFNAVRKTIDPNRRKSCFELFGYDFILDSEFNMWLIEVNTNPCIEESSGLLKVLLPRMIENMLNLTVDVLFPKNSIRRRKDPKKKIGSPQKLLKEGFGGSPTKRVSTANKATVQLQPDAEKSHSRYKAGGASTSDTEQTPLDERLRSKTNSSEAATTAAELTNGLGNRVSEGGDFTAFSQSIPDSEQQYNKDDEGHKYEVPSLLTTIKEKQSRNRIHPVPNYSDSENMWQKLVNLEKDPICTVTRHPNNKSMFSIQVQDKVFKLRKNPAYTGALNLPKLKPDPAELLTAQEQELALEREATKDTNELEEHQTDD